MLSVDAVQDRFIKPEVSSILPLKSVGVVGFWVSATGAGVAGVVRGLGFGAGGVGAGGVGVVGATTFMVFAVQGSL